MTEFKFDNWYIGQDLLDVLNEFEDELNYKKRYAFDKMMNYLQSNSTINLCGIRGLDGTGKSVMLRQGIRELIDKYSISPDRIAYIAIDKNTVANDKHLLGCMVSFMKQLDVKYFFIDDISFLDMNLGCNSLNLLADVYTIMGYKIVISGNHGIGMLRSNVLFDRIDIVDLTYFSCDEAVELFGYSREEYIRYGGFIKKLPADFDSQKSLRSLIRNDILDIASKGDDIYEFYNDEQARKFIGNIDSEEYLGRAEELLIKMLKHLTFKTIQYDLDNIAYEKSDIEYYFYNDLKHMLWKSSIITELKYSGCIVIPSWLRYTVIKMVLEDINKKYKKNYSDEDAYKLAEKYMDRLDSVRKR